MLNKLDKLPDFMRAQYAFTAHIRDPQAHAAPADIEDRRMAVYRELFYNNVEDFLASSYPVLRDITEDSAWHTIVRDYFARHRAHTPLFPYMPGEFLEYLQHEREPQEADPAFLLELAHYEWVELALSLSEETLEWEEIDPAGDLLRGLPVLSPLALLLQYGFPVHRIQRDFQPQEPGPEATLIIVYRNRSDEIGFMTINPATYRMLQLLGEQQLSSGRAILQQVAQEMQHPNPQAVIDGGLTTLQELKEKDIILGTAQQ